MRDDGGLLWPPDHTAMVVLAGPQEAGAGGSDAAESCARLHLLAVRYGPPPEAAAGESSGLNDDEGDGAGQDGGGDAADATGDDDSPRARGRRPSTAGRAVAALLRVRQAQQPSPAAEGAAVSGRRTIGGRHGSRHGVRGEQLAWLSLPCSVLPVEEPGCAALLDGVPLRRPGGAAAGSATVEAALWDWASFLAHLQRVGGRVTGSRRGSLAGGGPPSAGDSASASVAAAAAAAGLLGAYARGGSSAAAGILVDTLRRDMVAKQAALERLQRQADAAGAKSEAAAARVRDLQGRNR